jgi:hypothetical protein
VGDEGGLVTREDDRRKSMKIGQEEYSSEEDRSTRESTVSCSCAVRRVDEIGIAKSIASAWDHNMARQDTLRVDDKLGTTTRLYSSEGELGRLSDGDDKGFCFCSLGAERRSV